MAKQEPINSVLKVYSSEDENFVKTIDKIFKERIKFINSSEENKEELIGFEGVYQSSVTDVKFDFWVSVINNEIQYGSGINNEAKFVNSLIVFFSVSSGCLIPWRLNNGDEDSLYSP